MWHIIHKVKKSILYFTNVICKIWYPSTGVYSVSGLCVELFSFMVSQSMFEKMVEKTEDTYGLMEFSNNVAVWKNWLLCEMKLEETTVKA